MRYDERELLELHADVLYLTDARGRTTFTNEPDGAPAWRVLLVRGTGRVLWRLSDTVGDDLAAELAALLADEPPVTGFDAHEPPRHEQSYLDLLGGQAAQAWSGPAWYLPEADPHGPAVLIGPEERDVLRGGFDYVHDEYDALAPVAAVVVDGRAVTACRCSRRTDRAAEAGVDTEDGHTGRGHATAATSLWADAVRASGRLPLYSTAWTNHASRRIARRLGAVPYGTDWALP
ncbi:hypothetical protein ISU07_23360 [Nocardioides islandensis]|uniref:Uncharacterized protein n=1 Tax=Nocardioides islandensis TaxID=433663 RepID=A0A930VJV5_9ACTN|nr:hypothetical protein [Nocardioides islandensis]MBF4766085.1 hypothetical protein [Nocardioides islandensis]